MCNDYSARTGSNRARAFENEYIVQKFENPLKPNPVNSMLNLSSDRLIEGNVFIYNNIGENIIQQSINQYHKVIETDQLIDGLYHLKVVEKNGTGHQFKFIKP